jgi:ribulose kinase
MAFTFGIDYGTNSVRTVIVDCSDGREIGSCVVDYPTILVDTRLTGLLLDVTGCTMHIAGSSQTCALGSAISAAVLAGEDAGGQADFETAQQRMTSLKAVRYEPIPENVTVYKRLFQLYRELHDAFGGVNKNMDLSNLMKELIHIREEQTRD